MVIHMGEHEIKGMVTPGNDASGECTAAISIHHHEAPAAAGNSHRREAAGRAASSSQVTIAVDAGSISTELYQVMPHELLYRLAHLDPIRSKALLSHGVLAAPHGEITVAFMSVAGVAALQAWNKQVTQVCMHSSAVLFTLREDGELPI